MFEDCDWSLRHLRQRVSRCEICFDSREPARLLIIRNVSTNLELVEVSARS